MRAIISAPGYSPATSLEPRGDRVRSTPEPGPLFVLAASPPGGPEPDPALEATDRTFQVRIERPLAKQPAACEDVLVLSFPANDRGAEPH